jgi:hypothetical protein
MTEFSKLDYFLGISEYLHDRLEGASFEYIMRNFREFIVNNEETFQNCIDERYRNSDFNKIVKMCFYDSTDFPNVPVPNSLKLREYSVFWITTHVHAISITYHKNSDDDFDIILCNSGEYTSKHGMPENDNDNCYGILVFNNIKFEDITKFHNFMFRDRKVLNNILDDAQYFYFNFAFIINFIKNHCNDRVKTEDNPAGADYTFITRNQLSLKADDKISLFYQKTGDCSFKAFLIPYIYMIIKFFKITDLDRTTKINNTLSMLGLNSILKMLRFDTPEFTKNNALLDVLRYNTVHYTNYLKKSNKTFNNLKTLEDLMITKYKEYNRINNNYTSDADELNDESNLDMNILLGRHTNVPNVIEEFKRNYIDVTNYILNLEKENVSSDIDFSLIINLDTFLTNMDRFLNYINDNAVTHKNNLMMGVFITKVTLLPYYYVKHTRRSMINPANKLVTIRKLYELIRLYVSVLENYNELYKIFVYSFIILCSQFLTDEIAPILGVPYTRRNISVPYTSTIHKTPNPGNGLSITSHTRVYDIKNRTEDMCKSEFYENISNIVLPSQSMFEQVNDLGNMLSEVKFYFGSKIADVAIFLYRLNLEYQLQYRDLANPETDSNGNENEDSVTQDIRADQLMTEVSYCGGTQISYMCYFIVDINILSVDKQLMTYYLRCIQCCNDAHNLFISPLISVSYKDLILNNRSHLVQGYIDNYNGKNIYKQKFTFSDVYPTVLPKTKFSRTLDIFLDAVDKDDFNVIDEYDVSPYVIVGNKNNLESNVYNFDDRLNHDDSDRSLQDTF